MTDPGPSLWQLLPHFTTRSCLNPPLSVHPTTRLSSGPSLPSLRQSSPAHLRRGSEHAGYLHSGRARGAGRGRGGLPSSLLTIWRKRRMRGASCARNTCHTALTGLPGDHSPSPSRPERSSGKERRLRRAPGPAGTPLGLGISCPPLLPAEDAPFCVRRQAGRGASARTRTLTRSVTSTQRLLVPRCPRCGLTPVRRWRKASWEWAPGPWHGLMGSWG